jgi:hypothetical protein
MDTLVNPKILVDISRRVSKELGGVVLTDEENVYILQEARSFNLKKFNNIPMNQIINAFSQILAKSIKMRNNNKSIKEGYDDGTAISLQISEATNLEKINIKSLFQVSDKYQLQMLINPTALYERNYIELDSNNAIVDVKTPTVIDILRGNTASTTYYWEYMESALQSFGVVNTTAKIKNVVGIRMYPLKFAAVPFNVGVYNVFNILFQEFQSQAFIGHQGRKFHFTLLPTSVLTGTSSGYVEYSPYEHNKGYTWFRTPYTTLKSFTLTLAEGNTVISLPTSNQLGRVYDPSDYTNPGTITSSTVNLQTGNLVVISNFTTNDPIADAVVIAQVNDPAGHIITVIDASRFTIPVDLTVISPINRRNEFLIQIVNKNARTVIPLEIISLKNLDENDN